MLVAILAALVAAALFAVSTALQHRSAGLVTEADSLGTARLSGFISRTVRHPLWIVGSLAGIGGFVLHALALRDGPLTLVQPLLVSSAIFALALRQLLEHRRPRRDELGWAIAMAIGLVAFLAISTPANGVTHPADAVPTIVLGALIGIGVVGFFVVGRHAARGAAAAWLGAATGLAYAAKAGLLKQVVVTADHGASALATAWPLYAFIALWLFSLLLNQLAYQAGPLRSSLPAITTVDPVVSLVIGVAIFDERFRNGPVELLGEAVGLALVVAGAVGLTGSTPRGPDAPPAEPEERPAMTCSSPAQAS